MANVDNKVIYAEIEYPQLNVEDTEFDNKNDEQKLKEFAKESVIWIDAIDEDSDDVPIILNRSKNTECIMSTQTDKTNNLSPQNELSSEYVEPEKPLTRAKARKAAKKKKKRLKPSPIMKIHLKKKDNVEALMRQKLKKTLIILMKKKLISTIVKEEELCPTKVIMTPKWLLL